MEMRTAVRVQLIAAGLSALVVGELLLPPSSFGASRLIFWRVGIGVGRTQVETDAPEWNFGPRNPGAMEAVRFGGAMEYPATRWFRVGLGGAFAQRAPSGDLVRTALDPEGTKYISLYALRREYVELVMPLSLIASRGDVSFGLVLEPLVAWRLHIEDVRTAFPAREISLRSGVFVEYRGIRLGASYLSDRSDDLSPLISVRDQGFLFQIDAVGELLRGD